MVWMPNFPRSVAIHFRPGFSATAATVPLPQKKSATMSPGCGEKKNQDADRLENGTALQNCMDTVLPSAVVPRVSYSVTGPIRPWHRVAVTGPASKRRPDAGLTLNQGTFLMS